MTTWARDPGYLQVAASSFIALAFAFIVHGVGEEVAFKKPSQGGGGTLGTCIGLFHSVDLGIIIAIGDDAASRQ